MGQHVVLRTIIFNCLSSRRKQWLAQKVFFAVGVICVMLWMRDHDALTNELSDAIHEENSVRKDKYKSLRNFHAIRHRGDLVQGENNYSRTEHSDPENVTERINVVHETGFIEGLRNGSHLETNIKKLIDKEIDADMLQIMPGLGEAGVAAYVSPAEKQQADIVMKKEAFNLLLSEKISPNRSVPDTRSKLCNTTFDLDLPSASVIILFANEAFSSLLRTVHSVVNRSPARVLKEILLIDDFSDRKELGGKLERYVERFFNHRYPADAPLVRIHRMPSRVGSIQARQYGAKVATGEVLVYLDSHCECGVQWLEPMLQQIKNDRTILTTPIIEDIDAKTLRYHSGAGDHVQIGGFSWHGFYMWIDIPPWEHERRGHNVAAPIRSPTMGGGLFAIDRRFFWELGGYDEGMEIYGADNLEMSFRVWMCGGKIEAIPCSRVGHIWRDFHPFSFPEKDVFGINIARMAEVWMDDYKRHFYLNRPGLQKDVGSVEKRKKFRSRKQCHSFKWYLQNVIPQKFIPDENVQAHGRVRNNHTGEEVCLDTMQRIEDDQFRLGLYNCHADLTSHQLFSLTAGGQLRREYGCAAVLSANATRAHVVMQRCVEQLRTSPPQLVWTLDAHHQLVHQQTGLCLDRTGVDAGGDVLAGPCSATPAQIWHFDHEPAVTRPSSADPPDPELPSTEPASSAGGARDTNALLS